MTTMNYSMIARIIYIDEHIRIVQADEQMIVIRQCDGMTAKRYERQCDV